MSSGIGTTGQWGQVRASPSGSCLTNAATTTRRTTLTNPNKQQQPPSRQQQPRQQRGRGDKTDDDKNDKKQQEEKNKEWHAWRSQHLAPLIHPPSGFRHLHPIIPPSRTSSTTSSYPPTLQDKWRLVPECLQLRSLLRQHIDSYNHFVQNELSEIVVNTPSNNLIKSDYDPKFFVKYEKIWLSNTPTIDEDSFYTCSTTPQLCRLRDLTYSAPLLATIRYTRGNHIVEKRGVCVGRIPVMVRSQYCVLSEHQRRRDGTSRATSSSNNDLPVPDPAKSTSFVAAAGRSAHHHHNECPYDPGGYFIIKGVEKAILIQEQLSKNRVILEASEDTPSSASSSSSTRIITASITSSTHERKSKSYLIWKHGRVYLKNNTLGDDVPIVIVLRAMGMESDYEIVSWIAGDTSHDVDHDENDESQSPPLPASESCDSAQLVSALALSLEDAQQKSVRTQNQALLYIGSRIRNRGHDRFQPLSSPAPATPAASAASATGASSSSSTNAPPAPTGVAAAGSALLPPITARKPLSPEEEARDVLAHVVLSHVPVHNYDFLNKAIYVCSIVRRVLLVHLGHASVDDKDYYGNKRLELAGNLLSLLFEDLFKLFNKDLKRQADLVLSKPNRASAFDVVKTIRPDTITHGMMNAIATGNWVLKRFRMDRAGVTQVVSRLSYLSALGMMTRINSQFEKTRKVSGPRSLQPSQWGMLCPADTPEGEACGLVKNLALLAHITTDETNTTPIERLCFDLGVEDACRMSGRDIHQSRSVASAASRSSSSSRSHGYYVVFLNGTILGVHQSPHRFVEGLRKLRRQGLTGEFVSVYLHEGQRAVHLATDGGRVCRPLIIVDQDTGRPKLEQRHIEALVMRVLTMRDLLRQGIVEYVDCNEENNTLIAVDENALQLAIAQGLDNVRMRYTHLEIDPFTILGVVGGVIPFPHHNQAPRNTYTVAMAKQAMGTVALNQYERFDGLIYTLVYPQKPLVKSRTLDLVNFDHIPGGQNACIAVMSYSGYDIEDSIVLNKASIDRGFGRCMVLRKHQTSVRRYANGTHDRTCAPPDLSHFQYGASDKRFAKYSAVDSDGICRVGEKLDPGFIICNKESPLNTTNHHAPLGVGGVDVEGGLDGISILQHPTNIAYKPSSLTYRGGAPSYVDKVLITSNENEQFLIKVMLRQVRRPEIGDKFASRHGQKGVCGLIVNEEDLPFNEYGHVPDLIMNPHGFPSRMTVGKLLELLVGKAGLMEGRQGYSSAFGEDHGSADTASSASDVLLRSGLNYTGKDVFYSGTNGDPLDAYVFSGPVFYQKLKHMVLDKAHARARGPRAVLTRQPTEGRSRDGGLRLGEMERDCLIAYGASNLIMERLMHSSDAFLANVCLTCGLLQYQNWCQYCRSGENVSDIRLPYACKLLFQELQSMNVLPRLRLKEYT